jgi:hypothetical protein
LTSSLSYRKDESGAKLTGGEQVDDFLDVLVEWLQAAVDWLLGAIVYLYDLLVAALTFLYGLLVAFVNFIWGILVDIVKVFRSLYNFMVNDVIKPVLNTIHNFFTWLDSLLKPVLNYLHRLRVWYDKYWNKYVKPQLALISMLRKFLVILKLFHVHWATVLDNELAKLQARIIHNTEILRQRLNSIISWVQLIADPYGLIQKGVLGPSIGRDLDSIWATITGHPLSVLNVSNHYGPTGTPPGQSFADQSADMKAAQQGTDNYWSEVASDSQQLVGDLSGG